MTDRDFLVHIWNNIPEEYDIVIDGLYGRLLKTGPGELTIEDTQDRLRNHFDVIKGWQRESMVDKGHERCTPKCQFDQ